MAFLNFVPVSIDVEQASTFRLSTFTTTFVFNLTQCTTTFKRGFLLFWLLPCSKAICWRSRTSSCLLLWVLTWLTATHLTHFVILAISPSPCTPNFLKVDHGIKSCEHMKAAIYSQGRLPSNLSRLGNFARTPRTFFSSRASRTLSSTNLLS